MSADPQLSLFDAKAERDAAVARIERIAGPWIEMARAKIIETIPPGWRGTGEDLRLRLLESGLPEPHHENAWGALWLGLLPRKNATRAPLFMPTGHHAHMRTKKSHARMTRVYVRVPT